MSERRLLESVADAVAAGEAVDWPDVERVAAKSRDADLLHQLRVVSAIGATRRADTPPAPTGWSRWRETCVVVVLVIAVAQLVLAILGAPGALCPAAWPHVLNAFLFGVGGVVLLAGGGRDRRLPLLGGLFLAIGSAFLTALTSPGACLDDTLAAVLRPFQPEAFVALMLWRFVRGFPGDTQPPREERVGRAFLNASLGVGIVLFAVNAITRFGDWAMPSWSMSSLGFLDRNVAQSLYWPLLVVIGAPAIPFLLWKTRFERHEERHRAMCFVASLVLGLAPFVIAVAATPFVPMLREASVQQRVGVVLYVALASIVPATGYSVAVNQVMDLQFLVRTTLKYALARYAVWALSVGPIGYVGFDIYANRELTIAAYLEGSRLGGPLALSAVGLATLAFRQHLLRAVDVWFLMEPRDHSQTLVRLEQRCRMAGSVRGVASALAAELGGALRPRSVAVLLLNDDGTELIPVEGTTGRISRESTLLEVLRSTRGDVAVSSQALESIERLLAAADREWLRGADVHLLSLLVGSTGTLFGMVAIGEARSGLPYSASQCALVTAASGRAAMQIENRWLRGRPAGDSRTTGRSDERGLDWGEEPAAYCPACSLVWSPETRQCSCGVTTSVAALPLFVRGKFRLERLVGTGGMGVVYLAVDMVLDRQVAIKTLPSLRSESAERLHREARTMARVLHPNLALIYGTEQWRGTPMLVVEYLDGGTLRDWIRRGPVPFVKAIDLGIVLADVLDRVHAAGVLHRDVKPSNIGYTGDGRPKLLDFGLALLDRPRRSPAAPMPPEVEARDALFRSPDPETTVSVADRVVGTPLYLAPEALTGATPQPSFDLWGLAIVLYEAIAGRHPFAAEDSMRVLAAVEEAVVPDIREYRPACPPSLAALFRDALSARPSRRPASAGALGRKLHRLRGTIHQHAH